MGFVPAWFLYASICLYGPSGWASVIYVVSSPVAALLFIVNIPSPYLAGDNACQEEWLSRPFVQKASGEKNIKNATTYLSKHPSNT